MAFPLTDEQRYAVETLDVNCIVPAGAGSGKTRVLVERYLKIIEELGPNDPTIIEKIIAITFTEKAAKEMKERVRIGMIEKRDHAFKQAQLVEAMLWRDNLQRLERANISTIHSFCARVLREFPVEANIDPEFKVLDDIETTWLLTDVIEKELKLYLEQEKEKGISAFYHWVSVAGFKRTLEQLKKVYEQIASSGNDLSEIIEQTDDNLNQSPYKWVTDFEDLITACDTLYAGVGKGKNLKTFQEYWPDLRSKIISAREKSESSLAEINSLVLITKGNFGKDVKEARQLANDLAKKMQVLLEAVEHHDLEKEYIRGIYNLLAIIQQKFQSEKGKKNGLDFDELQSLTIKLLQENQAVRGKLQNRISYLMIDEFQDNNQVQKQLVTLLLKDKNDYIRPGSLFVVGDPKQSIYRFRGADVQVFKEMEESILAESGRVAPLQYNFRSHPQIINFGNYFFKHVMSVDPSSPNFFEAAVAMNNKYNDITDPIEYMPIIKDDEEEASIREKEAEGIAKRIQQLLEDGVEPKEITILFRSMTQVKTYERPLAKYKIPYYVVGGRGFYQQQEIQDLMHVLKYLVDPTNKIALAGILRSPIVALSDDSLYQIMTKDIWQLPLQQWELASKEIEASERAKLSHFVDWLTVLRNQIGRVTVGELIDKVIDLTSYYAILFALPNGLQAVANIEKLIRMAKNYPGDNPYSVFEFVQRMQRVIEDGSKETEAAIESETGNTVKLMTIHQSKGLEFPYVFVPDLAREPKNDDSLIRYTNQFGLTCKVPLIDGEWGSPIRWLLTSEQEKRLEREESVRVFYVATTRAEKKLILSGKIEDTKGKYGLRDVLQTNTWSKWLDVVLGYEIISYEDKSWFYSIDDDNKGRIHVVVEEEADNIGEASLLLQNSDLNDQPVLPKYIEPIPISVEENIHSVSAIKRYQTCPRLFYYVDQLSLNSLDFNHKSDTTERLEVNGEESIEAEDINVSRLNPMVKGTIVHELLEEFTISPVKIDRWQLVLEQKLFSHGISVDHLAAEEWESIIEEVGGFVSNFKESRFSTIDKETEVKTEYEFILYMQNGVIKGTIDRVDIAQDRTFSIIDYKTDKKIDVDQYRSQLLTYALYAYKNLNLIPKDVILYYVRHNETVILPISVTELDKWEKQLEEILKDLYLMHKIEDFKQNKNYCSQCDFYTFCETFSS